MMGSVSMGKRLVTAAVMCGLLVGVSGCESHSVLSGKSVGNRLHLRRRVRGVIRIVFTLITIRVQIRILRISILCRNTGITMLLLKSGG